MFKYGISVGFGWFGERADEVKKLETKLAHLQQMAAKYQSIAEAFAEAGYRFYWEYKDGIWEFVVIKIGPCCDASPMFGVRFIEYCNESYEVSSEIPGERHKPMTVSGFDNAVNAAIGCIETAISASAL